MLLLVLLAVCCCWFVGGGGGGGDRHLGSVMKKRNPLQPPETFTFLTIFYLKYVIVRTYGKHLRKKCKLISHDERGGGLLFLY